MDIKTEVHFSGPIFSKGNKLLRNMGSDLVKTMVELGEQRLDTILRPRPAGVFLAVLEAQPNRASTGHYRRSLSSRTSGLQGEITDGNIIYGPWLEGKSSRNMSTRFKGYASFRKTEQWMEKQVSKVAENIVSRYKRKFNGV